MLRYSYLVLGAILFCFSCAASNGPQFKSGTVRSAFASSWSTVENSNVNGDSKSERIGFNSSTGAFLTPTMESGVNIDYLKTRDSDQPNTIGSASWYGRYWFQTHGMVRSWMEGEAGYAKLQAMGTADDSWFWSTSAGITQFITPGGAVEFWIEYNDYSWNIRGAPYDITDTSIYFGYALFY